MAATDELTVEELSSRTGISVRNLRFYTTKGLVPPPTKRGRSAVYNGEHVARFELLQELQGHGLNLSAIERFFDFELTGEFVGWALLIGAVGALLVEVVYRTFGKPQASVH